jgi:hypothetical protein
MKPPNKDGGPVSRTAVLCDEHRAKTKTPDALGELSSYLSARWLRHHFAWWALGRDADHRERERLGRFITAIKEVQTWQR